MRRIELSQISRWVWAALALAAVWFVVQLAGADSITLPSMYGAFAGATPALFAAALMYVAPRERLIGVAALTFALPLAVTTVIDIGIALATRTLSSDWAYLGPRLMGASDAFNYIGWVFPIIAIFAIAFYIGPVQSRFGWLIVAIGVLMAVAQAANIVVSSATAQASLGLIALSVLTRIVWIGWAYLAAVTITRRMLVLAITAVSHILGGALTLVAYSVLQDQLTDSSGLIAQALLVTLVVLGVIAWAGMIIGILRELPRSSDAEALTTTHGSQEAFSAGR